MAETRLVEPSLELEDAFEAYLEDHRQAGEEGEITVLPTHGFTLYVEKLHQHSQGMSLPSGYVPASTYWLVQGASILGQSSLRHHLSPSLKMIGGHIGYRIRPSARQQGHGARILALTLQKARQLGLPRVLVTCDLENTPSARIIEKNGGVLEGNLRYNPDGDVISHYWIDLIAPSVRESIPRPNAAAVADHLASYSEPLLLQYGDELNVHQASKEYPGWFWCNSSIGAEGWVPEAYLTKTGEAIRIKRDYSSIELNVNKGEQLCLHFEESGWHWATNQKGQSGWVPAAPFKP
jgi:predicted acetyltransferase